MNSLDPTYFSFKIQPIDRDNTVQINLVAERMRETLVEVLGPQGGLLYSMDWLRDRVRWHLRPDCCDGEVFLALNNSGEVVGHTIVRIDRDEEDSLLGLISTIYVLPSFRMRGVASALLNASESWLLERHPTVLATDTSETNSRLIRLFEKRNYAISYYSEEKKMVRLTRRIS